MAGICGMLLNNRLEYYYQTHPAHSIAILCMDLKLSRCTSSIDRLFPLGLPLDRTHFQQ